MGDVTVQDVFNIFYNDYIREYKMSGAQAKAARCIMNCKTGAAGVNYSICGGCGSIHAHYNSCRSRCCPMCQELPQQKWIDARKEDVLEAPYFHVVFTLPEELNPVIYSNQKLLYGALYRAASETLDELSLDRKHLGAEIGYTCILHTWGSAMNYHPHLHCIAIGGGLDGSNKWRDNGHGFFMPIWAVSDLFKGKYMAFLKRLWEEGKLEFHGSSSEFRNRYRFKELMDACYGKQWNPYCKETFNGAQSVIKYLGKYTHRIAISNSRIVRIDGGMVTFTVKDYKEDGAWKELTITGIEFIRRFLMHVPPKRFVRIRHYGLLGSRVKKAKMALCRNLLGCRKYISEMKGMDTAQVMKHLYGIDICSCKDCGGHLMKYIPLRLMRNWCGT